MRQHSGIGVLDKAVAVLTATAERRARSTNSSPAPACPARPPTASPSASRCTGCSRATRTAPGGPGPALSELAVAANDPLSGGGQCPAAAARDHRRKRAVVPARGLHPGLRGVDGATHRPARHGARRRPATDDGRVRGEGVARVGRSAHAACGAARGVVHRARPTRGPARAAGHRAPGNANRAWRASPPRSATNGPSSPRYRCRAPSTAWAAAPAPAGPPTSSPPRTLSTSACSR